MAASSAPRFIVDANAGRLAGWLRLMGYDALFFDRGEDREMVNRAVSQNRVILTRDTRIGQRRLVKSGALKAVILTSDNPHEQLERVLEALDLDPFYNPFSRCMACNGLLEDRTPAQVRDLVPPYVFKTQTAFKQCPDCGRVFWRGTHWEALSRQLAGWQGKADLPD